MRRRLVILWMLAGLVCATAGAQVVGNPSRRVGTGPPVFAVVAPAQPVVGPDGRPSLTPSKSPLVELLDKTDASFIDLTAAVALGRLDFGGSRALMIGSGALAWNDGQLLRVLTDGEKLIDEFVRAGGVLVVLAQPDRPGVLSFLPSATEAAANGTSHDRRVVTTVGHPLVTGRHRLTDADLGRKKGVLYPGGCWGRYRGFVPVVAYDERGRYPILLEGSLGRGRIILVHLSPDLAALTGTADEKVSARLLIENLLDYTESVLAGKVPDVKPAERVVTGTVFGDRNANGVKDADEPGLARLWVSDGCLPPPVDPAAVLTDANGNYSLRLDAYSRFVGVWEVLSTHKGPTWRRIRPGEDRVDVGLVPRGKPLGPSPRMVYLTDVGNNLKPGDTDDPELAFMLGEISRLKPAADVLVHQGDARACELRAAMFHRYPGGLEVIHTFEPQPDDADPVATRDAFEEVFGPTPVLSRLSNSRLGLEASNFLHMAGPAEQDLSFRRGGLNAPPRFVIVGNPDEELAVETRVAGIDRLLRVVRPGLEAVVTPGPLEVTLSVADTAAGSRIPVRIALAQVRTSGERIELSEMTLPDYRLVERGPFTRDVEFAEPVTLTPGLYVMKVTASAPDGRTWHRNVSFSVSSGVLPEGSFGAPWSAPGGGDAHTGETNDIVEPPLRLTGCLNLGGGVLYASPVVVDNSVVVARLPRADTGAPTAKLPPSVRVVDHPFLYHEQGVFEVKGDHVLLTTAGKPPRTLRFDLPDGRVAGARAHLAAGGEFVCVVDPGGFAAVFARSRGAEVIGGNYDRKAAGDALKWQQDISPGCRQAVATDIELFTGNECLEIGTGRVLWKLDPDLSGRDHSVALSGKRLVISGVTAPTPMESGPGAKQVVLAVEPQTGKIRWEKVLADVSPLDDVLTPPPAVVRDTVFIGSADGTFHALALSGGEELWSFRTGPSVLPLSAPIPSGSGRICSGAVISDQMVFFGAADGRVYALDRRKAGRLEWSYDVGLPIVASPALSGNTLLIADWGGNLHTFVSLVERKKGTGKLE